MNKILFSIFLSTFLPLGYAQASWKYVECNCSADFQTEDEKIITVSEYVYCPESDVYDYSCYGDVIGTSLDAICEDNQGNTARSPNYDAPKGSHYIYDSLECSL